MTAAPALALALESTIPPPPPTERPIKVCPGCGRQFSADAWRGLELVAERWDMGGDGIDVFETRNCQCRSTICVHVEQLEEIARAEVRDAPRTDEEIADQEPREETDHDDDH